jgi:2,3,4,5-tetrahydropyridine-2-carboxylate N-succinyltransferase
MDLLQEIIEQAFIERNNITPGQVAEPVRQAILETLDLLDQGKIRIAEKIEGCWRVNEWVKKAVLLSFRVLENQVFDDGVSKFYDKLPGKFSNYSSEDFKTLGARIVPQAVVRKGAHISKDCIVMPSFINIGAFVDTGTLVDTWATVGSCAQIGKNVHLSGGVGIGGVLEPIQGMPTIIEDNCFIGARSEIVEGVVVEENSVISMGVFIGQSTKIYHRETGEIFYGRVPSGSVVVPGTLPAADGSHSLYAAIIIKQVDAKTRSKTSINELLRGV